MNDGRSIAGRAAGWHVFAEGPSAHGTRLFWKPGEAILLLRRERNAQADLKVRLYEAWAA